MVNFLLKQVADTYSFTVSDLISYDKHGKKPEARRMFVFCLAQLYQFDTKKIPEITNEINRSRAVYYRSISSMTFEVAHYKLVRNKYSKIKITMVEYLENVIAELKSWLANNPCFDAAIREEKLLRLADNEETLEYINNLKIS